MKKYLILISIVLSLCSCGNVKFDASGYVDACLDATYHEEYEVYAEFVGCSVEEAKTELEQQNQDAVDEELASLDIEVSQEQADEYLSLLLEVEHLTKYEVGESKETENGFEVPVTVYPLNVYEAFITGIEAAYQQAADSGQLTEETIFPVMLEYLSKCIDNAEYYDSQETMLQVTKDSEGIWQISEDEMKKLDDLLLPGI